MTVRDDDPRMGAEFVQRCRCSGRDGDVVLVGVVHDHPASTYRVRSVVQSVEPDVLALELPPVALGLFERYARDDRVPPVFGGEMSAAIQAAATDRVVGIDGPTAGFVRDLAWKVCERRPSAYVVRSVLASLVSVTRHALVCRIAATLATQLGVRLEVDGPPPQDCDWSDDERSQARDERERIRESRSFASVFENAPQSRAARFRDEVREEYMAGRLRELRTDGSVVGVVGFGHLDPVATRVEQGD